MSTINISNDIADFGYAGTVSSGTFRTWDLLDSFQTPLEALSGDESLKIDVREMLAYGEDEVMYGSMADDADELLSEVMAELNSVAPDGYVFGSHEGNGSDIGFWAYDPEDAFGRMAETAFFKPYL